MKLKPPRKRLTLAIRINILFFVVFVAFMVLILQLGYLTIVNQDKFQAEIDKTNAIVVEEPAPRGFMYDRNGNLVVGNQPVYSITYVKEPGTTTEDMLETAEELSQYIVMDTSDLSEQDKKDYWLITHPEEASALITEEEQSLDSSEQYQLQLERVPMDEINSMTEEELEVAAIFLEFNAGHEMSPTTVKNENVTVEEIAQVNEHLDDMPGVNVTVDWNRYYPYGDTLKTVFGTVSSEEEGVPAELSEYYLAKGYSLNDRVGKSFLEYQYEDLLAGQPKTTVYTQDKSGNVISEEVVSEGSRGYDLVLTIDMELQQQVEQIVTDALLKYGGGANKWLDRAFIVMMDPYTGEIYCMVGKKLVTDPETGEETVEDYATGTYQTAYAAGSVVKGATVLTGYSTGAIEIGTTFYDTPWHIKDTPEKSSWKNMGYVDEVEALKMSSNVYMFNIAVEIGGGEYVEGEPLTINDEAYDIMRNSFAQFGLGVKTGIDLPGEQTGYKGTPSNPGHLLDFSIGQFDTYTTMQLAQYASTIANGGYRVQPHLLKSVHEPVYEAGEIGPMVYEFETNVYNKIDNTTEEIERVQEGFRQCTQEPGGTAYSYFGDAYYKPAGKTGTAQAFWDGEGSSEIPIDDRETYNISFVSYAPYDAPQVAMAVLVPWAYQPGSDGHKMQLEIAQKSYEAFFSMYPVYPGEEGQ